MSNIQEAIALLRASGYRVTKPKPKLKARRGPTFRAEFSDGTVVRLSVCTSHDKPDFERGRKIARHAWASRHKAPMEWTSTELAKFCPPIVIEHFETDGEVIAPRGQRLAA